MKTIDIGDAIEPLAAYARKLNKTPLFVTKRGKPVAALLRITDGDLDSTGFGLNPRFLAMIELSPKRTKPAEQTRKPAPKVKRGVAKRGGHRAGLR